MSAPSLDDVLGVLHRVAEISAGDPEASRAVLSELAESLQRQGDKDERLLRGEAVDADVEDAGRAALELFCYWPERVAGAA